MRGFSIFEADGRSDGESQRFKLPGDGMPLERPSALTRTVSIPLGGTENYRTGRQILNLSLGHPTGDDSFAAMGENMSTTWYDHLKKDYCKGFPAHCGFEVVRVDRGVFETRLAVREEHRQQDGFVHAGVMATMADHTAGYAAFTLVSEAERILTIEFKINYFKPAVWDTLACRSQVVHEGKTILVSQSDVFSVSDGGEEKQVARATVTLMAVAKDKLAEKTQTVLL